jgi:hypothetical protein
MEAGPMENWQGILLFIICGALVNLVIAFGVLRGLASLTGVPAEVNTPRRALISLVTILPVAGALGLPFFIMPFIGPFFGTFLSACVAPMMFAEKYELTQGAAAKIIIPTVLVIYAVSGVMLYYALPMIGL